MAELGLGSEQNVVGRSQQEEQHEDTWEEDERGTDETTMTL